MSSLITQPKLQKNMTTFQRSAIQYPDLRTTKLSQNLRTTKVSSNPRLTKLTQAFYSTSKPSPKKQKPPIEKIYAELHSYINTVDTKIQSLLQKQSNEYKVVYQHYYNKFKDELQELKQKTLEQEKTFLKNDHVHYIENELKICREQAATYQNLYQKTKQENDVLRAALETYKKQNSMLETSVKNYLKEIKLLSQKNQQPDSNLSPDATNNNSNNLSHKDFKILFSRRSNSLSFQMPQKPQIKISLQHFSPKFNCLKSDSKISPQTNILSAVANEIKIQSIRSLENTQEKQIKSKHEQKLGFTINVPRNEKQNFETEIAQKAENQFKVFNICEWFLQCVESVNKQILQRKSRYSEASKISNQFRFLESLDNFLKIDKLQVLKMFISRKECVQIVYNMLKSQTNVQQNQEIYRKSQYHNSSMISKTQKDKIQLKHQNLQSHQSFNQTATNFPTKLKFTKTTLQIDKKSILHRSLNEKELRQSTTRGIQKTSNSLSKQGLNCIEESGEPSTIHASDQRSLTIAGLLEKRNLKRLSHIIKEKKNIRLSTQIFARKTNIFHD